MNHDAIISAAVGTLIITQFVPESHITTFEIIWQCGVCVYLLMMMCFILFLPEGISRYLLASYETNERTLVLYCVLAFAAMACQQWFALTALVFFIYFIAGAKQ